MINIEDIKLLLAKNINDLSEDDICQLDIYRSNLVFDYLEKRKKCKILIAENKKKQWAKKLLEKTTDKKLNKWEIESNMSEEIFDASKKEAEAEYEYYLYNVLREEIKEKINLRKKLTA